MSALIKRQYRGDPGLFGFIGKAIGSVAKIAGSIIPGPLGAIAKIAGTALSGAGKPVNPSVLAKPLPTSVAAILQLKSPTPQALAQGLPQLPSQTGLVNIAHVAPGVGNQTQSGAGAGYSQNGSTPCERGYHRNKVGYYTKRYGFIEAGSICVKNRKRNPLNPRALSRSMARLSSAKGAAAFLSRVTIREKGCGCK